MKASIIIRTKNEAKRIGDVLFSLSHQTEQDFEVVIVDSMSSDQTLNIAKKYQTKLNIKIFNIDQKDFTYPYACNLGAEKASGDFLVYISGHSVPINNMWLESGLEDFNSKNAAGVYGNVIASADASFWEIIFYGSHEPPIRKRVISRVRIGILGNTNAIIRSELWKSHHFDERYVEGGEDGEWAKYYLDRGYKIILDSAFTVKHSHGLGLLAFIKQCSHWKKLYNQFRKD